MGTNPPLGSSTQLMAHIWLTWLTCHPAHAAAHRRPTASPRGDAAACPRTTNMCHTQRKWFFLSLSFVLWFWFWLSWLSWSGLARVEGHAGGLGHAPAPEWGLPSMASGSLGGLSWINGRHIIVREFAHGASGCSSSTATARIRGSTITWLDEHLLLGFRVAGRPGSEACCLRRESEILSARSWGSSRGMEACRTSCKGEVGETGVFPASGKPLERLSLRLRPPFATSLLGLRPPWRWWISDPGWSTHRTSGRASRTSPIASTTARARWSGALHNVEVFPKEYFVEASHRLDEVGDGPHPDAPVDVHGVVDEALREVVDAPHFGSGV